MEQMVHKVVLSSGKTVLLKEMKIKHQNLAMQAIGKKAGDNQLYMATLLQQELLKILVVQIDGVEPTPLQRENLDELFSYQDFLELSRVVSKISGGSDLGELQTEIVTIGSK